MSFVISDAGESFVILVQEPEPTVVAITASETGSGGGGVTSVAVTGSDGISVSGSPITTSGTIALALGAITPDSVAATGTVTGSNLSGVNTGDQDLSTLLVKANNLSDLTNAVTARSNLGLGALATLSTVGTGQIDDGAVTFDKTIDIASTRLLGRYSAGPGNIEEITIGGGLSLSIGGVLSATGGGGTGDVVGPAASTDSAIALFDGVTGKLLKNSTLTVTGNNLTVVGTIGASNFSGSSSGTNTGDVTLGGQNYLSIAGQLITAGAVDLSGTHVTGTLAAARLGTFTGDVTTPGASYGTTIANNAVTFAKMQDVSSGVLLGRTTALAGDIEEITASAPLTLAGLVLDFDETAALGNNARVAISKNSGATVGTRRRVNLIEGTNVTLTITDDGINEEVDVTIAAAGGGGTPGGVDTQLQYNNAGAFGGTSLGIWNSGTTQFTFGSYSGTSNFITVLSSNAAGTAVSVDAGTGTGISLLTSASGTGLLASSTGGLPIDITVNDAVTNAASTLLRLTHNTTGTGAAGLAARIAARLETSTTADADAAFLDFAWANGTHASRQGMVVVGTGFPGVASAEKIRIFGNAATQQVVAISAVGSSGSAIALVPNGSNGIMAAVPTGTSTGGNARGAIAVDWQITRSNASEVASGTGACIPGGARNTASGQYCMVEGDSNTASGNYTVAMGLGSVASKYGQVAKSSVNAAGAQQMSIYTMSCATTNTTPEELRLDGDAGSQRLTLANNQAIKFLIHVVGKRQTTQERAEFTFTGTADKASTSASTRLVCAKTVDYKDNVASDCNVTADTTNGAIAITVTGPGAVNYTWMATVYATEVTY